MAGILSVVSIVSFVLAGILLALAVFFWIRFGIPKIIGELSGRTAKASIAKMRAANEKTGFKTFKPSSVNLDRGKLTETESGLKGNDEETEKLNISEEKPETGLLADNTIDSSSDAPQTDILDADTELLNEKPEIKANVDKPELNIKILDEIILIHTDEVI